MTLHKIPFLKISFLFCNSVVLQHCIVDKKILALNDAAKCIQALI
jgi:hypothetical protein